MRRKTVFVAVVALLGVLGIYSPSVQAGTGSPQECQQTAGGWGRWYIPILTSPVTVALEIGHQVPFVDTTPHPQVVHVAVCYSTSPTGYGGTDTTGGRIELDAVDYLHYEHPHDNSLSCEPQSNPSGVSTSCYVGTNSGLWGGAPEIVVCLGSCATIATHVGSGPGNTVWFSIPVTVCLAGCTTQNPSLGPTGVVVGSAVLSGGPAGTTTGTGLVLASLDYCVNGSCTSILPSTYVGAGTDVSGGPTTWWDCGPGAFTYVPFLGECVPGAATAHVGGTIAAVQVGSTMIPVNSPVGPVGGCVYTWEVYWETYALTTSNPTYQHPSVCD